jgi:hypothetical protein
MLPKTNFLRTSILNLAKNPNKTVHLSKEIQKRLDSLNSSVQLASTIDGVLPDRYSFHNKPGKSFRTEFGATENSISIVLYERCDDKNYEHCFARGLFANLDRLATVIDLWADKQKDIAAIKKEFDELELYSDFELRNHNSDIDSAWTKVKNMFFNDTKFWKYREWKERYFELLNEAKKHSGFKNYFPFTSHHWLRFSIDKDLKETWALYIYIVPTMYSDEIPNPLGKFYVSYNDNPMGGHFFETAKEGLDFYSKKLQEIKPLKWGAN